jgi:hypothetical protein
MMFGIYRNSNDLIILIFVIFKLYYMVKIFQHLLLWTSKKVSIIGKDNQVYVGIGFVFKDQFTQSPYITLSILPTY